MMLSVLTEKSLWQARHRKGAGRREGRAVTWSDSQRGQITPSGQRCLMNHASAATSSGNRVRNSTNDNGVLIPRLYAL